MPFFFYTALSYTRWRTYLAAEGHVCARSPHCLEREAGTAPASPAASSSSSSCHFRATRVFPSVTTGSRFCKIATPSRLAVMRTDAGLNTSRGLQHAPVGFSWVSFPPLLCPSPVPGHLNFDFPVSSVPPDMGTAALTET